MDPITKLLICLVAIAAYAGIVLTIARFCGFNEYDDDAF